MTNHDGTLFLMATMTLLVIACAFMAWWKERR